MPESHNFAYVEIRFLEPAMGDTKDNPKTRINKLILAARRIVGMSLVCHPWSGQNLVHELHL